MAHLESEQRVTQNYKENVAYLSGGFDEVNGYDFYCDLFPNTKNSDEFPTDFSRPNAVFLYGAMADEGDKLLRDVICKDTWEKVYMECVEGNGMTLCGGLTYRKDTNRLSNAQNMNALIFDLDGVGDVELRTLFLRFNAPPEHLRTLPMPTYIVCSGGGIHLYYVFEEPIALYPNIKLQLKRLKYDLTFRMWEYKGTSQVKSIEYQSINQGFRMVGSVNGKHDDTMTIRAFRTGEKVTLDYLNRYAKPENRVDINRPFSPTKMTREAAREAYPEWYQRRIVEGSKKRVKWDIAGKVHGDDPYALYHWWLRRAGEVRGGHRYFYLMCLAIYAVKCDVPKSKLRADMDIVFETLQHAEHTNRLTKKDIKSALEAYDKEYYNFTIADITKLSELPVERNKRNGQAQADHLEEARAIRDIRQRRQGRKWTDGAGRPKGSGTAQSRVAEWRESHPDGTKADCHRDTGLDPKTIRKWWETTLDNHGEGV